MQTWDEAQKWEQEWHGDCVNSLNEELKQLVYARRMGLRFYSDNKTPYNIDLSGKTVIDIGGGAYSLLLKCTNFKQAGVIEPISHPFWVLERYKAKGIVFINKPAEEIDTLNLEKADEAWIYNVLQHTKDPQKIVENMRNIAKVIRIFEWIDTPITNGHIQSLSESKLNEWLKGEGKVEDLKERGCYGRCYYGVFPT